MSEAMPIKAPPWFADGHKTAAVPPAESPSARRRSAMAGGGGMSRAQVRPRSPLEAIRS